MSVAPEENENSTNTGPNVSNEVCSAPVLNKKYCLVFPFIAAGDSTRREAMETDPSTPEVSCPCGINVEHCYLSMYEYYII